MSEMEFNIEIPYRGPEMNLLRVDCAGCQKEMAFASASVVPNMTRAELVFACINPHCPVPWNLRTTLTIRIGAAVR